jgi:hypothetical protein
MWPPVVQLVVAKCWDSNPKDYFTVPRTEPVRSVFFVICALHLSVQADHTFENIVNGSFLLVFMSKGMNAL